MTNTQLPEVTTDPHVFLIGRPPVTEFLGFIRTMAVNGHSVDQGVLMQEWRSANDHVAELIVDEAGVADAPDLGEIPPALQHYAEDIFADPMFQKAYKFVPTRVAIVELDQLVVFQKHINLRYVGQLKERLGDSPSEDEICRLALAVDRFDAPVRVMQTATNAFTFISPSNDFRFLEGQFLPSDQALTVSSTGVVNHVIGLALGYGSNYLNALHADGRLVLNNGSHRAYALRELGITHVPCLVQDVTRRDELELISSGDVRNNPERYLEDPRPPLLKDYFNDKLRKLVDVQRKNRLVRVQFGVEQSEIPVQ